MKSLFIKEKKFNVTSKTHTTGKKSDMQLAIPYIMLLAADLLALYVALRDAIVSN